MRQYLQGTLDFACGIYAVINALSCTHGIDLSGARRIFRETVLALSQNPEFWRAFIFNETDHYNLVRYLLGSWCIDGPWKCRMRQPFGKDLLPGAPGREPLGPLYLPEKGHPSGPDDEGSARQEVEALWAALAQWFGNTAPNGKPTGKAALMRFHRFLPSLEEPVISHWTTVSHMAKNRLILHDASSEKHAIAAIDLTDCIPGTERRIAIRIVPESLLLLERANAGTRLGFFSLLAL